MALGTEVGILIAIVIRTKAFYRSVSLVFEFWVICVARGVHVDCLVGLFSGNLALFRLVRSKKSTTLNNHEGKFFDNHWRILHSNVEKLKLI